MLKAYKAQDEGQRSAPSYPNTVDVWLAFGADKVLNAPQRHSVGNSIVPARLMADGHQQGADEKEKQKRLSGSEKSIEMILAMAPQPAL
jgi:hypothetical protein